MDLNVEIKILDNRIREDFQFPAYQSNMAAGVDLVACIDRPLMLEPGSVELIPTGIAIHIDNPHYAAVILPRSGMGHKKGLVLGNGTGLIDADYQGQLFVSAFNRNPNLIHVLRPQPDENGLWNGEDFYDSIDENEEANILINPGDRIAQLVFLPIARANFVVTAEFGASSVRGEGGFGSTGTAA